MKRQYENSDPIAIYALSNVGSVVILNIDEMEERVYYRLDTYDTKGKVHFGKIKNDSFRSVAGTIKLSECIRA